MKVVNSVAVTIKDVARIAGVSIATVSRVINNTKPVNEETRQRVMAAMEENYFRPNAMARGLVKKESALIGIVIPEFKNTVFDDLIDGISNTAKFYKYDILLCLTQGELRNEIHYLNLLREKQVDGIILSSSSLKPEHITIIERPIIPCILVGQTSAVPFIPSVHVDNFSASYEAVITLINKGHRKIGMIRGPLGDNAAGEDRLRGYMAAIADAGIQLQPNWIIPGGFSVQEGFEAMSLMLGTGELPTALFVAADRTAIGAMNCLQEHGYRIPEDVSIMGFDDIDMSSVVRPKLSTVQYSSYEIGVTATRGIMKLIRGEGTNTQHTVVPHRVIIRDSIKTVEL
jgi:LacI family transcriptional regulator